jgi:hypothetical protein
MECGDHGQPGQIVMQPVGTVKLTEHATVITLPHNTEVHTVQVLT